MNVTGGNEIRESLSVVRGGEAEFQHEYSKTYVDRPADIDIDRRNDNP